MLNTPDHGNLGDHAIALAEERFFKDRLPDIRYKEVTGDYYRKNHKLLKMIVPKRIVLGISGGGYIGDVWMEEEELVRNVISSFPKNKIIIFPQTVYYHDDDNGRKEWECTKRIIQTHGDSLIFCLRDKRSYDFIKNNIPEMKNIFYYPDMVLSLDVKFDEKREGILTCFRSDKEKILSDEVINKINSCAEKNGIRIRPTSTVLDKNVGIADRENEVYEKLREFASAKLVITDRLHAMLFAAITGTPCVAFDNETKKISGVYKWIECLDYISLSFREEIIDTIKLADVDIRKENKYFFSKDVWGALERTIYEIM
ncbi:polysaccharide pyruvyl transferase family protein [Butyrivibrio fibrisolvens]|uniref:polysaccharide pyruvyl transferase family protein n=1 Tax=Butyrivibrio fibrisolvens TaxID=831 RepID=UPI000488DC9F|nr:polysaccharide pyruvyl transferase family protein [Butyrivibrio fibrisolvens]